MPNAHQPIDDILEELRIAVKDVPELDTRKRAAIAVTCDHFRGDSCLDRRTAIKDCPSCPDYTGKPLFDIPLSGMKSRALQAVCKHYREQYHDCTGGGAPDGSDCLTCHFFKQQ